MANEKKQKPCSLTNGDKIAEFSAIQNIRIEKQIPIVINKFTTIYVDRCKCGRDENGDLVCDCIDIKRQQYINKSTPKYH